MLKVYLRVQPGSSKKDICYYSGKRIKVYVHAPPEDGKANRELLEYLADRLNISKKNIVVAKGRTGRDKVINIEGVSAADFKRIIAE